MTLTYQQQYVLDGLAGRAAISNLTARYNRAYSEGDLESWVTTFRHACGSGGRYWRDNPDVAKVADGEVPGVPGGRPRYCARCVRSITAHGGDAWTVEPPAEPGEPCTWRVR